MEHMIMGKCGCAADAAMFREKPTGTMGYG